MNNLVSFGLICCQQKEFIAPVLHSAFAQTYRPLQIVVSDDASSDGTFDLAVQIAKSCPPGIEIVLHQNEKRLGIGNCNSMVSLAKGDFIVMAHGDDISLPHRVESLVKAWQDSQCSMVTSNAMVIDREGQSMGLYSARDDTYDLTAEAIASSGWNKAMLGAVLGFEPAVITSFEPLNPMRSAFVHDWILPYRAAMLKGIRYLPDPLLLYRLYEGNYTSRFLNSPDDEDENIESHQATNIAQFNYMVNDTSEACQKGYITRERAVGLVNCIYCSMMASVTCFCNARNTLLSRGKRARWLTPEA